MNGENREYRENRQLVDHLLELAFGLDRRNVPIVLGGGMSVYLRQRLYARDDRRYNFTLEARSTNDLDVFLSSALIADKQKVEALRDVLTGLGYSVVPQAKNFQFSKKVDLYGQKREIKIDLLASPPAGKNADKVEIKHPRIKPRGLEGIHAHLTKEAEGIELGKLPVDPTQLGAKAKLSNRVLTIPSAFNTLILKFFVFNDRKNSVDEKSDGGRHHAFDIFLTVAQMGEEDWKAATAHYGKHRDREYLWKAVEIRKECFGDRNSLGLIRLRENRDFALNRAQLEPYLEKFIEDLHDLFPQS